MKLYEMIIKLGEQVGEELHDAKEYAEKALMCKGEYPELAELFYKLSDEECNHADMLRSYACNLTAKYTELSKYADNKDSDVFDYICAKNIKCGEKVKRLQEMFRS